MTAYTATERRSHLLAAVSHGGSYDVINLTSTVEIAVATTVDRTIDFGRIPSNARILSMSRLYWDDLATSGSPTLDLGLAAVDGNLANADDPNALLDAGTLSSAGSDVIALEDIANAGLPAWDFVESETSDPGGDLMVYGTLVDAPINKPGGGTMTLDLYYVVD